MKLVNLETGKFYRVAKSSQGFKVVYPHGISNETYISIRTIQIIEDDTYIVWDDYTVSYTIGLMFISIETGEKFISVRD